MVSPEEQSSETPGIGSGPAPTFAAAMAWPEVTATEVAYEPEAARRLSEVDSVFVHVTLANSRPNMEATLELNTPAGSAYEVKRVRLAGSSSGQEVLTFELAVAGTSVDLSGLSGRWSTKLFLDGTPLSTSSFELLP